MNLVDPKAKLVNEALELTGQANRTTDRSRKSVELAVLAAYEFRSPTLDSRLLLCGLVREGYGVAFHILDQLGLNYQRFEQMVSDASQVDEATKPRIDDDLTAALCNCWSLATSLQHNYIGTEHLLLGIVGAPTRARHLLEQLGIEGKEVDSRIQRLLQSRS
jgi:ATP-dependent Clp protease ATP-binding subunit ClpC